MMVTSKNFELIKFERERRCDLRDGLTGQRILLVTPGDDHDDDDDDHDDKHFRVGSCKKCHSGGGANGGMGMGRIYVSTTCTPDAR